MSDVLISNERPLIIHKDGCPAIGDITADCTCAADTASMVPLEEPPAKPVSDFMAKYNKIQDAINGNLPLSLLDNLRMTVFRNSRLIEQLQDTEPADTDAVRDVLFGLFFACGQMREAIHRFYGVPDAPKDQIYPSVPDPEIEAANRRDMPF